MCYCYEVSSTISFSFASLILFYFQKLYLYAFKFKKYNTNFINDTLFNSPSLCSAKESSLLTIVIKCYTYNFYFATRFD